MTQNFSASVDEWARQTEERLTKIFREAVQTTIDDAQKTKAKGGNMPFDTGFLRGSGQASLDGMPQGPTRPGEGEGGGNPQQDVALVINSAKIGDKIFFGWTAVYARTREYHDGFLRLAAQKWQQNVAAAVRKAKALAGGS